jgi:lactoylglutathione lyase
MREVAEPTPVLGLFETHINVRDLDRSVAFYRDVVGLELAGRGEERRVAFFWTSPGKDSMLGIWETGTSPIHPRLHFALRVTLTDLLGAPARLREHAVTPLDFDLEETDEPSAIGWMPAAAVFFADPDGHSVEYLALLDEPSDPEIGVVPYSTWRATRDTAKSQHEGAKR